MSFMKEVLASAKSIWDECVDSEFLTSLGDGTLDRERFLNYIVQDSIYLRGYAKVYGMAIYKSSTYKQINMFYSALGFVETSENATRLKYLNDFNMTDEDVELIEPSAENRAYTDFMSLTAKHGEPPEILMAVLPCMLGYYYVFDCISKKFPKVTEGYYGALVNDYTSDFYNNCCAEWTEYADSLCKDFDKERKASLQEIFITASRHELYFWQMAAKKVSE